MGLMDAWSKERQKKERTKNNGFMDGWMDGQI